MIDGRPRVCESHDIVWGASRNNMSWHVLNLKWKKAYTVIKYEHGGICITHMPLEVSEIEVDNFTNAYNNLYEIPDTRQIKLLMLFY